MSINFKYKSASTGSWLAVPTYAYHGTLQGNFQLFYPTPDSRDLRGRLCGATGLPYANLQSQLMTGSGMDFWMDRFSTSTAHDTEFWLTVLDTRSGAWKYYTGWLERPQFERVQIGSACGNTLYYNVSINMSQLSPAAS